MFLSLCLVKGSADTGGFGEGFHEGIVTLMLNAAKFIEIIRLNEVHQRNSTRWSCADNGLELSCLTVRATPQSLSRILVGKALMLFHEPARAA